MSGWHITYANLAGRQPLGTPRCVRLRSPAPEGFRGTWSNEIDNPRQGMMLGEKN
jgi:hypothetical protein